MKVLILAHHYAVASGRYVTDALRRTGHDVRTTGPAMGADIWGGQVDERYIWTPEPPEKGWGADLVLVMDAHLAVDRPKGILFAVYGVDNHVRDYAQYDADRLFLAHGHGMRMGEANVEWLPCGYDPATFTPGPPLSEREFDAAMVGVQYDARSELLYALIAAIPHVRIAYGTGAVYDQYAAVYQNARVSLVRSAASDVAQRVWETAAMGCVVLKDANPDDEALGLVHRENCLIYHDSRDAAVMLRWVLDNLDEAQGIADAGRAWAQSGTWDERVKVIVGWAEAQQKAATK